jgi:hypothetical protein
LIESYDAIRPKQKAASFGDGLHDDKRILRERTKEQKNIKV